MSNPVIETDIADILNEIKSDQKKILEEVNVLKLGQARIEGKIEAVDEKLSGQINALDTKVDQLDKRIGNQEFTNRGVFIGLVVVILGGASCSVSSMGETPAPLLRAAKLFGFMGNP